MGRGGGGNSKHSCSLAHMKSYKKIVRVDKDLKSAFKYLSAFIYQDGHKGLVDFLLSSNPVLKGSLVFFDKTVLVLIWGHQGRDLREEQILPLDEDCVQASCVSVGWTWSLEFCCLVWTLNFKMMAEDRKTVRSSIKARRKALQPTDD